MVDDRVNTGKVRRFQQARVLSTQASPAKPSGSVPRPKKNLSTTVTRNPSPSSRRVSTDPI
jgi:hypothetical protein